MYVGGGKQGLFKALLKNKSANVRYSFVTYSIINVNMDFKSPSFISLSHLSMTIFQLPTITYLTDLPLYLLSSNFLCPHVLRSFFEVTANEQWKVNIET